MSGQKERFYPFRGGLGLEREVKPDKERIRRLETVPNKLVRIGKSPQEEKGLGLDFRYRNFLRARELFKELEEKYGIKVIKQDLVRGRNVVGGGKVMFQVVDKIEGENLEDIKRLPAETQEKIDDYLTKFIHYFYDKNQNRQPFLWDINIGNVMYGRKRDSNERDLYLVDVDPYVSQRVDYYGVSKLCKRMFSIYQDLLVLESKQAGKGPKYLNAKRALLEVMDSVRNNPRQLQSLDSWDREGLDDLIKELKLDLEKVKEH